jgi:hypothetical protein
MQAANTYAPGMTRHAMRYTGASAEGAGRTLGGWRVGWVKIWGSLLGKDKIAFCKKGGRESNART